MSLAETVEKYSASTFAMWPAPHAGSKHVNAINDWPVIENML